MLAGFGVFDKDGSPLVGEGTCILGLMIFRYIRARHQNAGLPEKLKLTNGAGSCSRHHKIGCGISCRHIGYELCNNDTLQILDGGCATVAKILSGLPYHLNTLVVKATDATLHAFIESEGSETATYYKHCREIRIQAESLAGLFRRYGCGKEILTHGIACQHDLFCRKESLEVRISHADFFGFLGEELVSDSGIGVLFLKQCRHSCPLGCLQGRA